MDGAWVATEIETEPGSEMTLPHERGREGKKRLGIVLDLEGIVHARETETCKALASAGWDLMFIDVRATGRYAVAGDKIGRAPDHNSSEWSIWTARPLLGQWICALRLLLHLIPDPEK